MTLKRGNAPKAVRRRRSSAAVKETEIDRLRRELNRALEQQTATSEVLGVISRSKFELQPILQSVVDTAARLCCAKQAVIFRLDGGVYRFAAGYSIDPAYLEIERRTLISPGSGTLIGRAAMRRQVVRIDDAWNDPLYEKKEDAKVGGHRSMIGVPLMREGTPVGVIGLSRSRVEPFAQHEIELVTTFADQAVIAIENARLLNELRQRTTDLTERTADLTEALDQQTATSEVLQVISSSPGELEPVFDTMLANATRLCEATHGNIWRFDGKKLHAVAVRGDAGFVEWLRQHNPVSPIPGSAAERIVRGERMVHVTDRREEDAYRNIQTFRELVDTSGVRASLSVALHKDERLLGMINVYRQEVRPFSDKQIALVTNFAAQAVIAIENARLLTELRESLEQQTATSEVLKVISSSPGELGPVFEAMLEKAVRICDAKFGNLWLREHDAFRLGATYGTPPAYAEFLRRERVFRMDARLGLGQVTLTRQTYQVADVTLEPTHGDKLRAATIELGGARTLMGVPLLKDGEVIGCFVIYRQEVRPFTEKQTALVNNFAEQAVIAIENTRLLNELRQRTDELGRSVEELRALGEVSQAVNSTLDLETVLSTIVAKAVQLSGTEAGAIYVFDDGQCEFHLRATYGMDQELVDELTDQRIGLDEPNIELALAQSEPIQVADLREEAPSDINEITLRAGYRARLVAPLLRGTEVVGLLVVRRRTPGTFPDNTVDLIKTFAVQSVLAIQNARLFDNVETRTRELAKSLGDLRTAQDRLVQTEKLASLGQLTAGIAHEIKNPLNFVNNFSSVSVELIDELREALGGVRLNNKLRAEISEIADTLQGNLEKVVQHGKRADAIVKNMLLHSRQGSGERRPVDINALVDESLNLAYHGARAEKQGFNITLERSFDPAAGEVDLLPQEITRALLNLISNGFYAATKRKAEVNGVDYEPTLAAATKNLGDSVEIRVRDNGTGIPPEVKEKLFNPFFTTKPAGEGTGLGLSISHDIIVKQHGGSIEVDTQPGEFTEFRIVLPRAGASLIASR
jgi:two-component system NtrC family sensor kinase